MNKLIIILVLSFVFFLAFNYLRTLKIYVYGFKGKNGAISNVATQYNTHKARLNKTLLSGKFEYNRKLIRDGIFWSDFAESFVAQESSIHSKTKFVSYLRGQEVKHLKTGDKSHCGHRNNGIAVLSDGTKMCVRYRPNYFRIQAEALAFYLSRYLKMDNMPLIILARVNDSASLSRQLNSTNLPWRQTETVGMIKWIPHARKKCILPAILERAFKTRKAITHVDISRTKLAEDPTLISKLIQLGTSIIFDFLTCLRDRLHQWQNKNKKRLGPITIHNTVQSASGKIWLIDNESAFSCQRSPRELANQAKVFHSKMLKTMCVFQSSMVRSLQLLSAQPSAFKSLLNYSQSFEPLLNNKHLHYIYRSHAFSIEFHNRLNTVLKWIKECRERVDGNVTHLGFGILFSNTNTTKV